MLVLHHTIEFSYKRDDIEAVGKTCIGMPVPIAMDVCVTRPRAEF